MEGFQEPASEKRGGSPFSRMEGRGAATPEKTLHILHNAHAPFFWLPVFFFFFFFFFRRGPRIFDYQKEATVCEYTGRKGSGFFFWVLIS